MDEVGWMRKDGGSGMDVREWRKWRRRERMDEVAWMRERMEEVVWMRER